MRDTLRLGVIVLLLLGILSDGFAESPPFRMRRELRVALYPFVPNKDALFAYVKESFEAKYPEVAIKFVDLSDNYYDESRPHAITNTDADVYEVDSVFLEDLVASDRLRPIPETLVQPSGVFVEVAERAVTINNTAYGVPHWVCTNYLFTRTDDALRRAATLSDIETALSSPQKSGEGLLIDMKGTSTLGELYLDALLDRDRTFEKASAHLTPQAFDPEIAKVLTRVRQLCDGDLCRQRDYHYAAGFYARLFAHRKGRAMAGYSERLYYIGEENLNACKTNECTPLSSIAMFPLPLSDNGSQPFAWVDSFTIAKSCGFQCLLDAEAFIRHTSSMDEVRSTLMPGYRIPPRYLLPALSALYTDKALTDPAAAPLYGKLYDGVKQAIPVRGQRLNSNLREIGKKMDDALPK